MIRIIEDNKPDTAVKILNQIPEFEGNFTCGLLEKKLRNASFILVALLTCVRL